MVGIKDIAKKAGVSISTVSYALNGSSKVTEETRDKIKAIAKELDYVPNMAARTLKRQQTNIIGVYLAGYGGVFYGELLEGIKQGLAIYDYEMIVCSGKRSHLFIPERMIDGAIILDWIFKTDEIYQYADRGHSLVVLDRVLSSENIRNVLLDNLGGATLAIEKFVSAKSKKVYVISGPSESYDSQQRLKASIKELNRFEIDYEIISGEFTNESGFKAAQKINNLATEKPIDIFSLNDEMAVGLYRFFETTEYVIGKDVRVIGFDNTEISEVINPRLATISYSKKRWGMIAAEKIVQLIRNEETEDERIYTSFYPGDSFPS